MKRALAILGALFVCGAAATGYYQRWQPLDPVPATGAGPVLFDRDYIEFEPTLVGVPASALLVASMY